MEIKKDTSSSQRRALGRGLSALLPERPTLATQDKSAVTSSELIQKLPVDLIEPNPYQSRRIFSQEAIEELAQ